MKLIFLRLTFFSFLLLGVYLHGQTYKVTYKSFFEGKQVENQDPILLYVNKEKGSIISEKIVNKTKSTPYEVFEISSDGTSLLSIAALKENNIATSKKLNYSYQETSDTKVILGYTCRKALTSINSNTLEIWYTKEVGVHGGPSAIGAGLGLVLEVVRNGNSSTTAVAIEKTKKGIPNIFSDGAPISIQMTDGLTYKDEIWKSRFTTLSIFENELIRFSGEAKAHDDVLVFANGTVIIKKIKFPDLSKGQMVFAELQEESNGDAYDRTGSVFLIPKTLKNSFYTALTEDIANVPVYENGNGKKYQGVISTENYESLIEIMRFFTPFGVGKFNHLEQKNKTWLSQVRYRQDISDLGPLLSNSEFWVGVFIGNYDKGGHKISLEFTIHENDDSKNQTSRNVIPLFNTLNIMEMAGQNYATMFDVDKGLEMEVNLQKELKNAKLRYITTGHGGWEFGDEFLRKENKIFVDGTLRYSFVPWRTDCGSYRLANPASGNFGNGLSSSDYSRSNWCPGTTTNPVWIDLGNLSAGKHKIRVQIPQGEKEGSSFSSWNVSGLLLGDE